MEDEANKNKTKAKEKHLRNVRMAIEIIPKTFTQSHRQGLDLCRLFQFFNRVEP